ncbi:hypothetical protein I7I51_06062 [Histoplasma capsulatum]|uniref:Uncharacterized protein n=1 Tax=Ajellomyces capsulatus TaxID=5037 RepID=A0A8A1MJB1_AJECA|nr:hypothetical protein I7I51_06062 [Histoplasma capsulatum]
MATDKRITGLVTLVPTGWAAIGGKQQHSSNSPSPLVLELGLGLKGEQQYPEELPFQKHSLVIHWRVLSTRSLGKSEPTLNSFTPGQRSQESTSMGYGEGFATKRP